MIKVADVTKKFGKVLAVDSVTLDVQQGESIALLGANGAGKSTLIKCILGLLDYRGEIEIQGHNIKENPKFSKSLIGYVPQDPLFYDMKTVSILEFFGSIRGVDDKRINNLLNLVGLEDHKNKLSSELSGGMRQRLSFAIGLLSDPPVLILDEPTSNLDANARGDFLNLVKEHKDQGKTVLFSSHRLDEVYFIADRVLFMKSGRVILDEKPENLASSLGIKVKINLRIPESSIGDAISILNKEGFVSVGSNGSGLYVEVEEGNRALPFEKLIKNNIPIEDFSLQESSMETVINHIEANGY
ncbi:MAG: ABC transporter [Thermodesulfobacteriota bacterium]|nr:MAG: ABC transporter [Thermodesulfobacteriota bacterium]